MSNFTLNIDSGDAPQLTIDGQRIAIQFLTYSWGTSTDKSPGYERCMVTGFPVVPFTDDEAPQLPTSPVNYVIDFKTGEVLTSE